MTAPGNLHEELTTLHEEYTYRVNALLEEGREDLVAQLSDRFADDALLLMHRFGTPPVS